MKRLVEKMIRILGRPDYKLDPDIRSIDLFVIISTKMFELLRGLMLKPFLGRSRGLIFVGRRVTIKHKRKIQIGRSAQIGRNVEINALTRRGIIIGDNFTLKSNSIIDGTGVIRNLGEGLIIGNNVGISQNCFIQIRGYVEIGNNVILGPNVSVFSENHKFDDPGKYINEQGEKRVGVKIGDGVWIGTGAIILDGVSIGKHSVIAAGSVVNKNVPERSVYGGVPAKLLKNLINTTINE